MSRSRDWPTLGRTVIAFALAGSGLLLFQAVGLRLLDPAGLALVILVYGYVQVASSMVGVGMPQWLARAVSSDPTLARHRAAVWLFSVVPAMALSGGAALGIARLIEAEVAALELFILLLILILGAHMQAVESALRRGERRFASGAFVLQGAMAGLVVVLAPALYFEISFSALQVLALLAIIQWLLVLGSGVRHLARPSAWTGQSKLLATLRADGTPALLAAFWVSTSLIVVYRWIDRFVLAAAQSPAEVAKYQSLVVLTSAFDLLVVALGYIRLPAYVVGGQWSIKSMVRLVPIAITAAAITVAAAALVGESIFLVRWSGEACWTMAVLVALGVIRLGYADVTAALGATGTPIRIFVFSFWTALTLALTGIATYFLALHFGILGAAIGGLIGWTARLAAAIASMNPRKAA